MGEMGAVGEKNTLDEEQEALDCMEGAVARRRVAVAPRGRAEPTRVGDALRDLRRREDAAVRGFSPLRELHLDHLIVIRRVVGGRIR